MKDSAVIAEFAVLVMMQGMLDWMELSQIMQKIRFRVTEKTDFGNFASKNEILQHTMQHKPQMLQKVWNLSIFLKNR